MFTRAISVLLLVLTVSSALASPLTRDQSEDGVETKALSKRGAVLSAQFATESEVSSSASVSRLINVPQLKDISLLCRLVGTYSNSA